MILRVERRTTVGAFLEDLERRHGGARGFRAYVRAHPRDLAARADLEDYEFFRGHPEMRSGPLTASVTVIPLSDTALSVFTKRRMAVLDALARGAFDSTRDLAQRLGRDIHNVHGDLQILHELGIVEFERGPGRRLAPRLAGDAIRLEFGRSPRERPDGVERGRRILEREPFIPLDEA